MTIFHTKFQTFRKRFDVSHHIRLQRPKIHFILFLMKRNMIILRIWLKFYFWFFHFYFEFHFSVSYSLNKKQFWSSMWHNHLILEIITISCVKVQVRKSVLYVSEFQNKVPLIDWECSFNFRICWTAYGIINRPVLFITCN